ncbi:MAG: two-component sensor histidine kinase [Zetaproteobacteria bacterium]|nr:MAG: two-component sensor histidine kinase [Zetaproteobacteria bacterium]
MPTQPEELTISHVPLPLLQLDHAARVIGSNLMAQEALNMSNKRLVGLHLADLFAPYSEIQRLLERLHATTSSVSDHYLRLCERDMPVSLHLGIHDHGMMALFVPEGHRSEIEQHTKRHEIAEAMAHTALEIAHEVKNPLATLRGATQWLCERSIAEQERETLEHMLASIDRIRDRIDAFLQIGPRADVQMEMTNIHALIQEVSFAPDHLQVSQVFDPSLPETLAHRARLRQALENLWQNAVEAAEHRIEWQTRMAPTVRLPGHCGPVMEVRITNDGATVPERLRERLFEPYVTAKERGSGLGLALVQRVMLEHSGRVSLCCETGRTTFVLHLPVRRK